MKSRARRIAVILVLCFAWGARRADAVGLGGYVSAAAGSADGEAGALHGGAGVSLDTGIGRDGLFGYRLQVGYERIELDEDSEPDSSLDGVVADNIFGFRVARGEKARLWIGPQVRLAWYGGEDAAGPAFGLGAGAGVDVALGRTVILAAAGGYRDVLHVHGLSDLRERLWHLDLSLLWKRGAP